MLVFGWKSKSAVSSNKMISSDSKPDTKHDVDNNGILNGNLINDGQIIEKIDDDIVHVRNW